MQTKSHRFLRFFTILLVLLLAAGAFSAVAVEEGVKNAKTVYNVALVIDASASLVKDEKSDVGGLRYQAISMLLDTLTAEGNEVGAYVFNDYTTQVAPISPADTAKKADILSAIKAVAPANWTDFGTALNEAVKGIAAKQKQQVEATGVHLPSIVVLFTDGVIDFMDGPLEAGQKVKSAQNRDAAIAMAQSEDIDIFGIFLNSGGNIKGNRELFDIVKNTRNNPDDPADPYTNGKANPLPGYAEVRNSADLNKAFTESIIAEIMGVIPSPEESLPVEKEIIIPGMGVSELTINVRYIWGVKDKIRVSIRKPDGTVVQETSTADVITHKEETYFNAKMIKPSPGKWYIRVDPIENDPTVTVSLDIKVSTDIMVATDVQPWLKLVDEGELLATKPVQVTSWLEANGQKADTADLYTGYTCNLILTNTQTNEETAVPMVLAEDLQYYAALNIKDFSEYKAEAEYISEGIKFRSPPVLISLSNQLPVIASPSLSDKITFNLLKKGIYEADSAVLGNVSEPDGQALTWSIVQSDWPGAKVAPDGSSFTVDTQKKAGSGVVRLRAEDPNQAAVEFSFSLEAKNTTAAWVIGMGAAIALAVLVILLGPTLFGPRFSTPLTLKFDFKYEGEYKQTEEAQLPGYTLGKQHTYTLFELSEAAAKTLSSLEPEESAALDKQLREDEAALKAHKFTGLKQAEKNFRYEGGGSKQPVEKPGFSKQISFSGGSVTVSWPREDGDFSSDAYSNESDETYYS